MSAADTLSEGILRAFIVVVVGGMIVLMALGAFFSFQILFVPGDPLVQETQQLMNNTTSVLMPGGDMKPLATLNLVLIGLVIGVPALTFVIGRLLKAKY